MLVDEPYVEALHDYLWQYAPGEANAVSRLTLCLRLGCSDRKVREAKAQAVVKGIPICAAKSGGYFLAETPEEIRGAKAQHLSYLRSHAAAIDGYDVALREMQEKRLPEEAE